MDVEHEDVPPKVPTPHEILWFPSGNVVLSTDSFLFKVHKDILSMQSSVFKDMFDFPTGDSTQMIVNAAGDIPELYEGLPTVNLVGDKGEDVAHLLRAVYERQYYHRDNDETPLEVVVALLDLSTKYDFRNVRTDVIVQISKQYPTKLLAYDFVGEDYEALFGTRRSSCHYPLLGAVFKAKVDALLPVLYYACSDVPTNIEFTVSQAKALDAECLQTMLNGSAQLDLAITQLLMSLPDLVYRNDIVCSNDCPTAVRVTGLVDFLGGSKLSALEGTSLVKHCVKGACGNCTRKLEIEVNSRRQEIWDKIPIFFGFPGWGLLRKQLKELI